jgi:hypothetical protein
MQLPGITGCSADAGGKGGRNAAGFLPGRAVYLNIRMQNKLRNSIFHPELTEKVRKSQYC